MLTHSETRPVGRTTRSAAERAASATKQRGALNDRRPAAGQLRQLAAILNPSPAVVVNASVAGRAVDRTGLPASLKTGIENLSGQSLDHVRVHRNSSKPAQLQAHAFAQGGDIHLAAGQEKHLPHEAWHVVQQAQGRVRPTIQAQGVAINDDSGLEREADVMGARAVQMRAGPVHSHAGGETAQRKEATGVVQRKIDTTPPTAVIPDATIPDNYPTFTGLPVATKTVHRVQATTSPADPPGMATWKQKGYLGDPSKFNKQALTRMHAIRGKFGGPSRASNMFLGTALSNNFHSSSHFKEVEEPLEQYLKGKAKGEARAFDYFVAPNFGAIPGYMASRIATSVAAPDVSGFTGFANSHIPNGFTCTAVLYSEKGGTVKATPARSQHVATDVGAPTPAPVQAPPPVQAPVPAQAPAQAPVNVGHKLHATASESGVTTGTRYGVYGAALGAGAAFILSGPIGLAALGGAAIGATVGTIYGYATAEND